MSGCKTNAQSVARARAIAPPSASAKCAFCVTLLCCVVSFPSKALGTSPEPVPTDAFAATDEPSPESVREPEHEKEKLDAAGICNPLNICGDPDCSTAAKCSAGCFGNPVCASQCGGSRCNVGCNPGVCGSGCPEECNAVTCPQNICTTACGDPSCKVVCGGGPCNAGCPNQCDPVLCPANALCLSICGGSSCNVGCSPCEAGCPEACNPVVCPANALCVPSCGGSPCNVGCNPGACGAGCPTECDPVLCPQNILDCIWALLNDVEDRVNTTVATVTEAAGAADEVRDGVRDGVVALTDQLRTAIDGALADVQRIVENELGSAEYAAFTDGANSCSPVTCEPFRQELLLLLDNFESSTNGLFQVAALEQLQLDLGRMRGVIELLPGRILFPLYRVLKMDNGDLLGSLSDLLAELNADLEPLGDIFATDNQKTPICTVMTSAPLVFKAIIIRKKARAIALKVLAKIFDALGETSASADAGVHGYVHITYQENIPQKLAAILKALSDSEFAIAGAVKDKLEFCLNLKAAIDAQQWQLDMMDNQTQMLDAISGNPDLNYDGNVNIKDFAVFQRKFGSVGAQQP